MFVTSPDASTANVKFLSSLHVAAEWKYLGTLLEVPQHQLAAIEVDNFYQSQPCLTSMFEYWLNNCVSTCESLIQAVNALGKRDEVKRLCEKYGERIVSTALDTVCSLQY